MAEETIDRNAFASLQETAGAEFVHELVDTFLDEAPRMLDELRDALAKEDAERFRRTAHSLKSNANTFGASALGRLARELELGGVAFARDSAKLDDLAEEYRRVAQALKDLCRA
jgi:HPt (histidine-containing phosphotransfer) domain-containing protein